MKTRYWCFHSRRQPEGCFSRRWRSRSMRRAQGQALYPLPGAGLNAGGAGRETAPDSLTWPAEGARAQGGRRLRRGAEARLVRGRLPAASGLCPQTNHSSCEWLLLSRSSPLLAHLKGCVVEPGLVQPKWPQHPFKSLQNVFSTNYPVCSQHTAGGCASLHPGRLARV